MSSAPSASKTFRWPPARLASRPSPLVRIFNSRSARKAVCSMSNSSATSSSNKGCKVRSRASATWRASLIPLLAVRGSLIGTFAVMKVFGFSRNNLSLFGLVLAIGIVVDDAIVVVENVERNIALGLAPVEATKKAMNEVSGPVIAVALVLCAVFVPTAFVSGITGQFYRQFALTIAVSTVISAFNSLTLSPALSAILLQGHHVKKDWFAAGMDRVLGWFFKLFNKGFEGARDGYIRAVSGTVRRG